MEKIAVIGAGLIGRAWAMVFARAGHAVALFDAAPGAADAAIPKILQGLKELRRYELLAEAPDTVAARVRRSDTLADAVADADYVQENTPEKLDLKIGVYRELDELAPSTCILASSTSTFRTSQFSEALKGRDRCIVAHPVNPPHVIPLVEIAPAPWTRADVVHRTRELMQRVGQSPILLKKEVEGFVLNRLQAALLREAWRLVEEGYVSVEDLDRTMKDGLGLRWAFMGPFETIDLNAPNGVTDYARRYGPVFHALFEGVDYQPWGEALVARVEGERRALLAGDRRQERESWRDRRLMALVAHRRDCERKEL